MTSRSSRTRDRMILNLHRLISQARPESRAFALIELVAVLAVMAILSAVIIPPLIRVIDRAAAQAEAESLRALSTSLREFIRTRRAIPSGTSWADTISAAANLNTNQILLNARGRARLFLVDPNFGMTLPYTQGTNGLPTRPASPRFMILGSISTELPATPMNFTSIWNTADGMVPSGWVWNGKGDELKIERVALDDLFRRLIINDIDPTKNPYCSIADSAAFGFGARLDAYYIGGTSVGLHQSDGSLVLKELLTSDRSYVYERGLWRGGLMGGVGYDEDFCSLAMMFCDGISNPWSKQGTIPNEVCQSMRNYFQSYFDWARTDFDKNHNVYQQLKDDQKNLDTLTMYLIGLQSN